jgi:hypothetical protein
MKKNTLEGVVTDSITEQPIAGVTVRFGRLSTVTDSRGHYSLQTTRKKGIVTVTPPLSFINLAVSHISLNLLPPEKATTEEETMEIKKTMKIKELQEELIGAIVSAEQEYAVTDSDEKHYDDLIEKVKKLSQYIPEDAEL